jgi:quinolinate synthase
MQRVFILTPTHLYEVIPMSYAISHIQEEIIRLKKACDVAVLAHSYQAREIIEIADYTGDSFKLSADAATADNNNLLMCGVRFMAETAKLLSPGKRVFLANTDAGCPMAEQLEPELLMHLKKQEPDRVVVAYINTTAELKALCDVCVTSASAVEIVKNLPQEKILFIPDCNLGDYVKRQCTGLGKDIKLIQGGCPVHAAVSVADFDAAKAKHPDALVLVHPECLPAVAAKADYVGSTTGIMKFAKESSATSFIIGTEISIVEHLQYECPGKAFFPLSKKILCPNMKLTTLPDVLNALREIQDGDDSREMVMGDELMEQAGRCVRAMLK